MGLRRANAPQDPYACLKSALHMLPSRGEASSAYRSKQVWGSLVNKKVLHEEIKIIPLISQCTFSTPFSKPSKKRPELVLLPGNHLSFHPHFTVAIPGPISE